MCAPDVLHSCASSAHQQNLKWQQSCTKAKKGFICRGGGWGGESRSHLPHHALSTSLLKLCQFPKVDQNRAQQRRAEKSSAFSLRTIDFLLPENDNLIASLGLSIFSSSFIEIIFIFSCRLPHLPAQALMGAAGIGAHISVLTRLLGRLREKAQTD